MAKPRVVCKVADRLRPLLVPIGSLSPDPANARLHPERSIEAISASLKRFGQQKPAVVDTSGVLIAGSGLLQAAKGLGWTHVAVVRSALAGVERTAYAIADNRTAELSTWDNEALRALAESMPQDALFDSGFTTDELEQLLGQGADQALDVPAPKPLPKAVARLGEVWILGRHRLMCGDSRDPKQVTKLMKGERAALFATDPPYLVGYDGTNHPQSFTGGGALDWSESYGKKWDDADGNSDLYERFIAAAVEVAITPDAAWYCWHASRRQGMLEAAWEKAGAFVHCQIVWSKNRPVLTRTWYLWQHEPCFFGWMKGKKPKKASQESVSTVWAIDTIPNGEDRPDHPTPKPIEVFAIPMRQHLPEKGLCYEPFSGSGSQIMAAEQLKRRCYAMELEPVYVDVAIRRWETMTGESARLERGPTWSKVAASRGVTLPCPSDPNAPAPTPAVPSSRPAGTAKSTKPKSRPGSTPGPARKAQRAQGVTARGGAA